jgi:hypothetical protein
MQKTVRNSRKKIGKKYRHVQKARRLKRRARRTHGKKTRRR